MRQLPNIIRWMRRLTWLNSSRKCLPQLRTARTRRPSRQARSSVLLPLTPRTVFPLNLAAASRSSTMEGPSGIGVLQHGLQLQCIGHGVAVRRVVKDDPRLPRLGRLYRGGRQTA
ncbi:hypothetical protein D3C81_1743120 [compost metagenome]